MRPVLARCCPLLVTVVLLLSVFSPAAAAGGASERAIMAQTGHRSTDMVRRYIREANLFAPDNAASLTGL